MVAATVRTARDLDLAEECVQDAYATAIHAWVRDGIPANPAAWLTTTAKRRAIDSMRREQTLRSKLPLLIEPDTGGDTALAPTAELTVPGPTDYAPTVSGPTAIGEAMDSGFAGATSRLSTGDVLPDDRLRLVFLCCHPALPVEGQAALTLRLVCGISTPDIARLFLVSEPTMAARITRAKKKIAGSRIPFRMPSGAELPDRLASVLNTVYLLFTAGHTAPSGADLVRPDVVDAAVRRGRALHQLMPDETEVAGLLALMLVTDARRSTRLSRTGRLLRLQDQDRSRWNRELLDEGDTLIQDALRRAHGRPGRYTVQAAIAALYAEPAHLVDTDWVQILYLYDQLLQIWASPVVALNRIVPLSYAAGPEVALSQLEQLERAVEHQLASYPYLPAVKADLLTRLDRQDEAVAEYRRARDLTENTTEHAFLTDMINSQ